MRRKKIGTTYNFLLFIVILSKSTLLIANICNNILFNIKEIKEKNKIKSIEDINSIKYNINNTINNTINTTSIKYYTYNKRKYTYTGFNKKRLKKHKRGSYKAVG